MTDDLVMPSPAVSDLSKASKDHLVEEVKMLRQFTGLMLLRLNDYVNGQELSQAMEKRMTSFEKDVIALRAMQKHTHEYVTNLETRIDDLERKVVLYEPK